MLFMICDWFANDFPNVEVIKKYSDIIRIVLNGRTDTKTLLYTTKIDVGEIIWKKKWIGPFFYFIYLSIAPIQKTSIAHWVPCMPYMPYIRIPNGIRWCVGFGAFAHATNGRDTRIISEMCLRWLRMRWGCLDLIFFVYLCICSFYS